MEKAQIKQNCEVKSIGFKLFVALVVSIQFPINMVITYFYGTYIEIILCMLSFFCLRYNFPKTYHSNTLLRCMTTTAIIFWIANIYMAVVGINISILVNIIVGLVIGYVAYLYQDYIDLKSRNKKVKHNRDKIIELLNGNVSKENIFDYCKSHGIKEEVGQTIDYFLRMTIEDVCKKEFLTETAVKKRIKHFIESANY